MFIYYEAMCSVGYFLASIVPFLEMLVDITPVIIFPLILVSGLVINTNDLKFYLKWLEYISPLKYGFSALL